MKILRILDFAGLSKPVSGGQSRFFNMTKQLKKNGHHIIVLEPFDFIDLNDKYLASMYYYKNIKMFGKTFSIFRDLNVDFILKIIKILKTNEINLIQISYPSGILAVKIIILLLRKKIPIIYDSQNVESDFVIEAFSNNKDHSNIERILTTFYIQCLEKIICKYIVDYITSVSDIDKEIFHKKYKINYERIYVIPSGCNISVCPKNNSDYDIRKEIGVDSDKKVIFFHGFFSHPPNKDAFQIIENYIAPKFEDDKNIQFLIGGTGCPKFERHNLKSVGYIDNLYELLSIVTIAIVPLKNGSGTKIKIFDYMAIGLPIVSTRKGIEGINAKKGEHAIIVNKVDQDFINAIRYLLNNDQERIRIGKNAKKLAIEVYDWENIGKKSDAFYNEIIRNENK